MTNNSLNDKKINQQLPKIIKLQITRVNSKNLFFLQTYFPQYVILFEKKLIISIAILLG